MTGQLADRINAAMLTKTERRIADYMLQHSETLYFTTAKDLAMELGVSDTSVIRLCRSLGYKGYKELQQSMQGELSRVMEQGKYVIPQEKLRVRAEQTDNQGHSQCLDAAIKNLQTANAKNAPEKYLRAAELILGSEHIFVAGFRGSASLSMHLGVLLSQFVKHVEYHYHADSSCVEAMASCGAQDCVILIGAERYSKMTRVLAEMAKEADCKLIVLTDKPGASFAAKADIVFVADVSGPYVFNSYVSMLYIIENLGFELSKLMGVWAEQNLSRLNRYLTQLQLY